MSKTIRLAFRGIHGAADGAFEEEQIVKVKGEPVFVVLPESDGKRAQLLIFDVTEDVS